MATEASTPTWVSVSDLSLPHVRTAVRDRGRAPWLLVGLTAVDTAALVSAFALAYLARFTAGLPMLDTPPHSATFYISVGFWAIPVWLGLFAGYGLYDRQQLFAGPFSPLEIKLTESRNILRSNTQAITAEGNALSTGVPRGMLDPERIE